LEPLKKRRFLSIFWIPKKRSFLSILDPFWGYSIKHPKISIFGPFFDHFIDFRVQNPENLQKVDFWTFFGPFPEIPRKPRKTPKIDFFGFLGLPKKPFLGKFRKTPKNGLRKTPPLFIVFFGKIFFKKPPQFSGSNEKN